MDDINRESTNYVLARIEEKLDAIIANQVQHDSKDEHRFAAHSDRIGKLETAKSIGIGALLVLGALFSDKLITIAKAFN